MSDDGPVWPQGWRPASIDDLPALARLENATDTADAERFPVTADDLASQLLSPSIDIDRMTAIVEGSDRSLIGWCGLEPRFGGEVWNRIHIHGTVHPEERGRGLGRALLAWAERSAADVLRSADGVQPALPDVLTVHANEGALDRARLQERCGYRLARWYSDMFRALAEPPAPAPLPPGASFVPWTRERDEAYHAADVDAFRDHWGSPRFSLEAWRHEYADDSGFRPDLTVGVERQGEIVGYVMVAAYDGLEDDEGRTVAWLARLGVRRGHRARGIATAAISHALAGARRAGFATAGLDVDTESPTGALRLYERLGFESVKRVALRAQTVRRVTSP